MAYDPPIGSIYHLYTTWILPSGGLYATYHLLREPETTFDIVMGIHEIVWMAIFPTKFTVANGSNWVGVGVLSTCQLDLDIKYLYE